MSVELRGVTFAYPQASDPALENVTLSIPEGCFALVIGTTGSGKSTLLRTMNGLVPHFTGGTFEGNVEVEGRSTLDRPPRELSDAVAFVPQEPGRSFVLDRVEDELAYAMENLAVAPQRMRRRVEETLDLLDLAALRTRPLASLSGGEKQRVAIAAALTPGARVLLLDEPTSQLDPQGAEDVLAALHRLVHELGVTVIAAEHRLERVATFADIVVTCDGGRVEASAPARALSESDLAPPVTRVARLLEWPDVPLTVREARRAASGMGLPAPEEGGQSWGDPIVRVVDVTAGYGRDHPVLRSVDIELAPGEIVALMGRNGAGKSTLLRCITGIHVPATGTVTVDGHGPEPGRDVGLCPQSPEDVLFSDTVQGEIDATVWVGKSESGDIVTELRLAGVRDKHPRDLSSGQRLITAIGAIVATGAPVLLLDEPTRGLDPRSKQNLGAVLKKLAAEGTAIMFATHDVELVAALATRVVMLSGGEVIADGPPADVLSDSAVFSPQMTRVFGPGWLTPEQVATAGGV